MVMPMRFTIRSGALWFLGLVIIIVIGGCAVSDRSIVSQADQTHSGLKPAVIQDRELAEYVQAVGDRVIQAAQAADRENVGPKTHFSDQDRQWMFSNKM